MKSKKNMSQLEKLIYDLGPTGNFWDSKFEEIESMIIFLPHFRKSLIRFLKKVNRANISEKQKYDMQHVLMNYLFFRYTSSEAMGRCVKIMENLIEDIPRLEVEYAKEQIND